jgi:hypothetical protein
MALVMWPIPLILIRLLWPSSLEASSAIVFSSSTMLWFRLRICSTMTRNSIWTSASKGKASISFSFLSLDKASFGKLMPRADRILLTLFFSAVRNFTSVSRVCARLAT